MPTTITRSRRTEIDNAIAGMSPAQLHCRRWGHNWTPNTVHLLPRGGADEVVRCTTCDSYRHSVIDSYGDVITNVYRYADGYLIEGLGRLVGRERGMLRLASARVIEGELVGGA